MKTLLYTTALFLLVTSCRSIDKMVEKGNYDEAIIFATEKLAGKKNKKTKHVKGLEEAFAKITQRDMDQINYYNGVEKPENWDRIYDLASDIERRQNRIAPFLPLISKEGYIAKFNFVKTGELKTKALQGAAAYYYEEGKRHLQLAENTNDKRHARDAYRAFQDAQSRINNYKDSRDMMTLSLDRGQVRILVDMDNNSGQIIPEDFLREVKSITVKDMNTLWKSFYLNNNGKTYDYNATLSLTSIDVSPEREILREHEDSKEITGGWEYLRNDDDTFVIDSSGNKVKIDKKYIVNAYIFEIKREKSVLVTGELIYRDNTDGEILTARPISVEAVFEDYASRFSGDRRALSSRNVNRLKSTPLPFPNDYMMIMDASNNLKSIFKTELRNLPI